MALVSAFLLGMIFGLGLGLAGMTQPAKIVGFLDVAGTWDPSLLFVMAAAVSLTALAFPLILRRDRPVLTASFTLPARTGLDAFLLIGSALFGIGWGLSGYCPGPAVVSLVTGSPPVMVFLFTMVTGLIAGRWLREIAGNDDADPQFEIGPFAPEERTGTARRSHRQGAAKTSSHNPTGSPSDLMAKGRT